MAGRGDPPEEPTDGLPGGGEDEYGAVVFDDSFVRAARLREYSAQERSGPDARAVHALAPARPSPAPYARPGPGGAWVVILLALMVALAFAMAVHFGLRRSAGPAAAPPGTEPPRITVIPLTPSGRVPGATLAELLRHGPAAHHRIGASGITLPGARATRDFSESDVLSALTVAKEYLVVSSLDPAVLTGATDRPVRILLTARQLDAFERSVGTPPHPTAGPSTPSSAAAGTGSPSPARSPDSRTAPAAGWLVRFDPGEVALADTAIRVHGTLDYAETAPPPGGPPAPPAPAASAASGAASLFVVQRELRFRFDHEDLARHQTEVVSSRARVGPHSCSADLSRELRPLLAGESASPGGPAATDPYAIGPGPAVAVCGTLADSAQPAPAPGPPPPP
ncbi:hypothetical protein [Streptomyces sp. NPDC058953]|uniref:SCO2583 family membrane protein n=1 Tax=Streptomyces sp. NPDC058953 TaxID=3346676 RepID=UPI0036B9565A